MLVVGVPVAVPTIDEKVMFGVNVSVLGPLVIVIVGAVLEVGRLENVPCTLCAVALVVTFSVLAPFVIVMEPLSDDVSAVEKVPVCDAFVGALAVTVSAPTDTVGLPLPLSAANGLANVP